MNLFCINKSFLGINKFLLSSYRQKYMLQFIDVTHVLVFYWDGYLYECVYWVKDVNINHMFSFHLTYHDFHLLSN